MPVPSVPKSRRRASKSLSLRVVERRLQLIPNNALSKSKVKITPAVPQTMRKRCDGNRTMYGEWMHVKMAHVVLQSARCPLPVGRVGWMRGISGDPVVCMVCVYHRTVCVFSCCVCFSLLLTMHVDPCINVHLTLVLTFYTFVITAQHGRRAEAVHHRLETDCYY